MSSPYTSVSISGYNSSPPDDDGSEISANQLTWSKHKLKLGDPLKTAIEAIDANNQAAWTAHLGQTAAEAAAGVTPTNYEYEPGDVRRYGAIGDGVTDDIAAFREAYSVLNGNGGEIYVPGSASHYICSGSLDLSTNTDQVIIRGDNDRASIIEYTGSSTFITGSDPGLYLQDIGIEGTTSGSQIYTTGAIAINTSNNVKAHRVRFARWDEVFNHGGGFYHKFVDCIFDRCKRFFGSFSSNNLSLHACKLTRFEEGIQCNGGQGPVSLIGCSIERWFTSVVQVEAGASFSVNLTDCYVENAAPSESTLDGIGGDGDTFNDGNTDLIVAGDGALVTLKGNMIATKGLRRIVNQSGASNSNSYSRNTLYSTGSDNKSDTFYVLGTTVTGLIVDYLSGSWSGTYISSTVGNRSLTLYDPTLSSNNWRSVEGIGVVRKGAYTGTLTGCTTSPTVEVEYERQGDDVKLTIPSDLTATSNANTCTITGAPTDIQPGGVRDMVGIVTDNGTAQIDGIDMTVGTIRGELGLSSTGFTTSGTKGFPRQTLSYKI